MTQYDEFSDCAACILRTGSPERINCQRLFETGCRFNHGLFCRNGAFTVSTASISDDFSKESFVRSSADFAVLRSLAWLLPAPRIAPLIVRLGVTEFRRRLFHMSPALLPIALPFIPHPDVWRQILIGIVLMSTVIGMLLARLYGKSMKRCPEESLTNAAAGYAIPIVASLLFLPGRAELGLMTLQIVALGDGSATLGGLLLGGPTLPWNQNKTYAGFFCFSIVGTCAATYSYWGEANPNVSLQTAWLICGVAAICAAIVETLPIRSNDNLRVGATALSMGLMMSAIFA